MIGTAYHPALNVTVPVFAIYKGELQILHRGRMIWVRRADWNLVG